MKKIILATLLLLSNICHLFAQPKEEVFVRFSNFLSDSRIENFSLASGSYFAGDLKINKFASQNITSNLIILVNQQDFDSLLYFWGKDLKEGAPPIEMFRKKEYIFIYGVKSRPLIASEFLNRFSDEYIKRVFLLEFKDD